MKNIELTVTGAQRHRDVQDAVVDIWGYARHSYKTEPWEYKLEGFVNDKPAELPVSEELFQAATGLMHAEQACPRGRRVKLVLEPRSLLLE